MRTEAGAYLNGIKETTGRCDHDLNSVTHCEALFFEAGATSDRDVADTCSGDSTSRSLADSIQSELHRSSKRCIEVFKPNQSRQPRGKRRRTVFLPSQTYNQFVLLSKLRTRT